MSHTSAPAANALAALASAISRVDAAARRGTRTDAEFESACRALGDVERALASLAAAGALDAAVEVPGISADPGPHPVVELAAYAAAAASALVESTRAELAAATTPARRRRAERRNSAAEVRARTALRRSSRVEVTAAGASAVAEQRALYERACALDGRTPQPPVDERRPGATTDRAYAARVAAGDVSYADLVERDRRHPWSYDAAEQQRLADVLTRRLGYAVEPTPAPLDDES